MSHRWKVLLALFAVVLMAPVAMMQSPDRATQITAPADSQDSRAAMGANPLNTTAADAVNLIPDGTSVSMAFTANVPQWFAARVEGSKSYVVEALLAGVDRNANDVTLALYENDGTTTYTGTSDCSEETRGAAPSMQASSTALTSPADGARCTFYPPVVSASLVLVKVSSGFSGTLKIRMRETTVYSRWTTNSYNMYVAVHNMSQSTVSGVVVYYQEGIASPGPTTFSYVDYFTLGGWGSTQFYHASGSLAQSRGQVRIVMSKGTDVQVQTYAFNPSTGNYLVFFPERLNHGSGNTW